MLEGGLQAGNVTGEIFQQRHVFGEFENGERVRGPDDLADEVRGGVGFNLHVLISTHAGIDHQGQIERAIGLRFKALDFLRDAVLGKIEGILSKIGNRLAVGVDHADQDVDQIRLNVDDTGRALILRKAGASGRSCRDWRAKTQQRGGKQQSAARGSRFSHLEVDSSAGEMAFSTGTSPSAQTAPPTKCSFFQMGTVRFSVSIP